MLGLYFPMFCCSSIPHCRLGVVLFYASAEEITPSQMGLGRGNSTFSRDMPKFGRRDPILWHAPSISITQSQHSMGWSVALLDRLTKPLDGFAKILRHTLAALVADTQGKLS